MIKVGSDFSGVGAFNQALMRLGIEFIEVFACDMDKYARQTYVHNYSEPPYYPTDVYHRAIPTESLDIYMTSPPCQAFSIAGRRLGKDDKRGILFFNSLEFIQLNNPRYFIFENVKGLLSDDNGKTFSEWINLLGGKSVNGNTILFPYEDSVPYHLYWRVLNSKDYSVPQNRERVFLVGIRDDSDNSFRFPMEERLTKRLKDLLEQDVSDKYFLSDKMVNYISKDKSGNDNLVVNREIANTITCEVKKMQRSVQDNYIDINKLNNDIIMYNIPEMVKIRKYDVDIPRLQECLKSHKNKSIKDIAEELNIPKTEVEHWFRYDKFFGIPNAELWHDLKKCINITTTEFDASITEFIEKEAVFEKTNRVYDENGIAPAMTSTSADERILVNKYEDEINQSINQDICTGLDASYHKGFGVRQGKCRQVVEDSYRIRRLTPRECFRLMDFPDSFSWICSDSQAYKQAGNSIVVNVLYKILKNLNLQ